jgi:polyisoprenoid-binding protein YceI
MTLNRSSANLHREGAGVTLAIERPGSMTSPHETTTHYGIDSGVTGTADLMEGTLDQAIMCASVTADSLSVENDISDKDRKEMQRAMSQEVLEAGKFPNISYECSQVSGNMTGEGQFAFVLEGDLTLHGVTRSQPISGRAFVTGDLLRASGEFALRLSDYKIAPVSAVGGGLKLKDELKISFDVVARKQG